MISNIIEGLYNVDLDEHGEYRLSLDERVELIFEAVAYLRLWKAWLTEQKDGYKLSENFVTSNTYLSCELLAHSLVHAILRAKEAGLERFAVWILGSQENEELFRAHRTGAHMGTTKINMTFFDFVKATPHMEGVAETKFRSGDLGIKFVSTRKQRKAREHVSGRLGNSGGVLIGSTDKHSIGQAVERGFQKAWAKLEELRVTELLVNVDSRYKDPLAKDFWPKLAWGNKWRDLRAGDKEALVDDKAEHEDADGIVSS